GLLNRRPDVLVRADETHHHGGRDELPPPREAECRPRPCREIDICLRRWTSHSGSTVPPNEFAAPCYSYHLVHHFSRRNRHRCTGSGNRHGASPSSEVVTSTNCDRRRDYFSTSSSATRSSTSSVRLAFVAASSRSSMSKNSLTRSSSKSPSVSAGSSTSPTAVAAARSSPPSSAVTSTTIGCSPSLTPSSSARSIWRRPAAYRRISTARSRATASPRSRA